MKKRDIHSFVLEFALELAIVLAIVLVFSVVTPWYMNGGLAWLGGPKGVAYICECFGDYSGDNSVCGEVLRRCYATQTAVVAQQTPPAWWP